MSLSKAQIAHLTEKCALVGQTIVVVGAGGNIGNATCKELAMRGAVVVPSRTSSEGLEESVALIQEAGSSSESCPGGFVMNLVDYESVESGFQQLIKLAEGKITGVFLNAGGHDKELVIGPEAHFGDTRLERVVPFFMRNVLGHEHFMRLLSSKVRDTKGFVGVANTTAACDGLSRVPHYRMVKAALNQLWQWFAVDHAIKYQHRFVAVEPGFASMPIESRDLEAQQNSFAVNDPVRFNAITDQIPLQTSYVEGVPNWASGEEIADVVANIFSDSSRYVNGTAVRVDAGFGANKLGNTAV